MNFAATRILALLTVLAVSAHPAAISASTDYPIEIVKCYMHFEDGDTHNLVIGVSFKNVDTRPMSAVKFDFILNDAFNKTLDDTQTGTIYGKFSPDILIEYRTRPGDGTLMTQPDHPDSPAWEVYNFHGNDVAGGVCKADSIRYEDGTVWTRP